MRGKTGASHRTLFILCYTETGSSDSQDETPGEVSRMQTEIPKDIQQALKKSLWKVRSRKVWEFFCPNCKQARRMATPRQPFSPMAMVQLLVATAFFMLATWSLW